MSKLRIVINFPDGVDEINVTIKKEQVTGRNGSVTPTPPLSEVVSEGNITSAVNDTETDVMLMNDISEGKVKEERKMFKNPPEFGVSEDFKKTY